MIRQITRLAIAFIGVAASIFTIVETIHHFYKPASPDGRIGLYILGAYSLFFFLYAVVSSRKGGYAEALQHLHLPYHFCLSSVLNTQGTQTESEIRSVGEKICNQLASAFSIITGTVCSVCIKIIDQMPEDITKENPNLSVSTWCRDDTSTTERHYKTEITNWLNRNTDFIRIFRNLDSPQKRIFFCNNLPWLPSYINTSFEIHGEPKNSIIPGGIARMIWGWPLLYRSTIVAAIYPIKPLPEDRLAGYLCVDSPLPWVFRKRFDGKIMNSIAAGLYPLVTKWLLMVSE